MSETNLTGSGEPAPQSGGDAGAGSILSENPAPTSAPADQAPTSAPADPAPAPQAADGWISGFEGEDLGWLQNRGLQGKSTEEAIKNLVSAQRNAEKRLGVPSERLLTLPEDATSEGAMDSVWDALGRPQEPAGYELDRGDTDLTGSFADTLGATFHENGVTVEQAKAIEKTLETFFGDYSTQTSEADAESQRAALNGLVEEWGGEDNFNINVAIAKDAVRAAGATVEEIDALESAFGENGNAAVIRFFNRLGQKRGVETDFIAGDGSFAGLGATTPEAARAKMTEMKADSDIAKAIIENNPENKHVKRYRNLAALATRGK